MKQICYRAPLSWQIILSEKALAKKRSSKANDAADEAKRALGLVLPSGTLSIPWLWRVLGHCNGTVTLEDI